MVELRLLLITIIVCLINVESKLWQKQMKKEHLSFIDGCRCGDTYDDVLVFSADRTWTDVDSHPLFPTFGDPSFFTKFLGWDLQCSQYQQFEMECLNWFSSIGLDFKSVTPTQERVRTLLSNSDGSTIAQFTPVAVELNKRLRVIHNCAGNQCPLVRDVGFSALILSDGLSVNIDGQQYELHTNEILVCGIFHIVYNDGSSEIIKYKSDEPIRAPNQEGGTIFRSGLDRYGEKGQANGVWINQYDAATRTAISTIRSVLTFPATSKKPECEEPCSSFCAYNK